MPAEHAIAVDLANVYLVGADGKERFCTTLAWGDLVERVGESADGRRAEIVFTVFEEQDDGSIVPKAAKGVIRARLTGPKSERVRADQLLVPKAQDKVLKVDFVDVQQGDGAVIETPKGKVVLVDGGDNAMFARYLANRFRGSSAQSPKAIDCIVVTHGDADHFSGLTQIFKSEQNETAHKRLFMAPRRVFHNGMVKRQAKDANGKKVPDVQMLGATVVHDGRTYVTGLVDDVLDVPAAEMNEPFRAWRAALQAYKARGPMECRRLRLGDDARFAFLEDEGVKVRVVAPIPVQVNGQDAFPFLGTPKQGRGGRDVGAGDDHATGGLSASHTINGHSVVFRLDYGKVGFLFTGDLNHESGSILLKAHNDPLTPFTLKAEVLKVPHHGSADFSPAFLGAVEPVVSVVSSGDQNARKEYIHPRATLMAALGRCARTEAPLVFVTELVAFFKEEGWVQPETHEREITLSARRRESLSRRRKPFYAFSRTAFGSVKVRTDGQRLLVFTNSGQADMQEAYAYTRDENDNVVPARVRKV